MKISYELASKVMEAKCLWAPALMLGGEAVTLPDVQSWLRIEHEVPQQVPQKRKELC